VILVDPPSWPAHGRLWSHLVSDTSYAELHAFARGIGVPARGFDRDHYDVPEERYDAVVAAGARPVGSREVVVALTRAGLRRRRGNSLGRRAVGAPLLRPRRLVPGDVVSVVAPAGPVLPERLAVGVRVLESWGLTVRFGPHVLGRHPSLEHLAGTDAERAADLRDAWCAPDVAAVWAARGGYGCHRLVDLLDWPALAEAGPRLLIGFSDVTALHEALAQRLGVVGMHAPVVTSLGESTDSTQERVRRTLFEPEQALRVAEGLRRVTGGVAEGVLVGGNARVLTAGLGTPVSRPAQGGLVVLEDIGEPAYKLDGLLTQLLRAGWFAGVRGVVTGHFSDAADTDVDAVLVDRLSGLGVPVVSGAPVGHEDDNRPVPLGVPARLDADAGTLDLLLPALA